MTMLFLSKLSGKILNLLKGFSCFLQRFFPYSECPKSKKIVRLSIFHVIRLKKAFNIQHLASKISTENICEYKGFIIPLGA